jgi:hypothetical protein
MQKLLLETLLLVGSQFCRLNVNAFLQPFALVSRKLSVPHVFSSNSNTVRSSASSEYEFALIFDCDGKKVSSIKHRIKLQLHTKYF